MYVTSLHVQGLRGAEEFEARALERIVDLPAGPSGVAIADALSLFVGALDKRALQKALLDLALAPNLDAIEITEADGFPTQVRLPDGAGVRAILPTDGSRNVRISVELELDPPLYGRLRGFAVRDPRLVTALGAGARVTVKVGWLFTTDITVASLTVLGLTVGDTAFPLTGSERPSWLADLLKDVGGRFGRVVAGESADAIAKRLMSAAFSADPERRRRYQRVSEACEKSPFSLGRLEIVAERDRVEACFGPDLARARQYGPSAAEALRMCEAVLLDAPDIVIIEAPGFSQRDAALVRGWLEAHARGDRATIEQVILAPGGPVEVGGAA